MLGLRTVPSKSTSSRFSSCCRLPPKSSASERQAMKLKFKMQTFQTAAVQAVVDCFKGQPRASADAINYRIDPGKAKKGVEDMFAEAGFKNADLKLTDIALFEN